MTSNSPEQSRATIRPVQAPNRVFDLKDLRLPEFMRVNSEIDSIHEFEKKTFNKQITNIFPSKRWEYPWALLANVPVPGESVLDAGCGTSPLPTLLARRGVNVIVLEQQSRWAETQALAAVKHEIPIQAIQADLRWLPFANQSFDRVYCISVLEHLSAEGQILAITEMTRVLKPCGSLIVTVDFAEQEYVNVYEFEAVTSADIIFDWRAVYRRIIWPSGLRVIGAMDFCPSDWDAHRQDMEIYHHRPYTSFGLMLRKETAAAREPQRYPAAPFTVGINLPWLGARYANDLGSNVHHPHWGFGYKKDEAARSLDEIGDLGFDTIRFWLFEAGEGLAVDVDHCVSAIRPEFVANFINFQELLKDRGLKAYWCLLDANAYVYSREPILFNLLTSERHAQAFVKNALHPLLQILNPTTCFGIDLMNEPEACISDRWNKPGVSWYDMHRLLRMCAETVSSSSVPAPFVSCGSGWRDWRSVAEGRFDDLGV